MISYCFSFRLSDNSIKKLCLSHDFLIDFLLEDTDKSFLTSAPNIFGIINNYNEIILNKYGEIVNHCWQDLTNHYHNCLLDTYVIMPDHFHGIVQIINIDENAGNGVVDAGNGLKPFPTAYMSDYP